MHERLVRTLTRSARAVAMAFLMLVFIVPSSAVEAPAAAENPEIEARMMAVATELRCLVCQNQTIADSHAGLAEDLRRQIREMLAKGKSEREILDYMTERYGDFVLYRPPFKPATALLWIGPALLMAVALTALATVLRRRQRMSADVFDPDTPDEEADDDAPR